MPPYSGSNAPKQSPFKARSLTCSKEKRDLLHPKLFLNQPKSTHKIGWVGKNLKKEPVIGKPTKEVINSKSQFLRQGILL